MSASGQAGEAVVQRAEIFFYCVGSDVVFGCVPVAPLQKKEVDFAAEVAAQTGGKA